MFLAASSAPSCFSQENVDAEQALRSIGSQSWYDRSQDSYKPPSVEALRTIRYAGTAGRIERQILPSTAPAAQTGTGWNWNGLAGINPDLLTGLFTTMVVLVLLLVFGLLAYFSLRNYVPARLRESSDPDKIQIDPTKVVDLPFEVEQQHYSDDPLENAKALMQAGKYREAIIFLYGYQLLALDQSRKIELQRGKTNRMYLRD